MLKELSKKETIPFERSKFVTSVEELMFHLGAGKEDAKKNPSCREGQIRAGDFHLL